MTSRTRTMAGVALVAAACLAAPALARAAVPGYGNSATTPAMPSKTMATTMPYGPFHHKVAVMQEALNSTGAGLHVDGVWGPNTTAALKQFQRDNGLQATGRLNTATRAILDPIG